MKTISVIFFGLAIFLGVAGAIYGLTSHEPAGTVELLAAAITCGFLGIVAGMAHRRMPAERAEEDEVHIGPTIWPLGFAVSGVVLVVGVIVSPWLVILGAAACALSAAGWFRDVARSRAS